MSINIPLDVKAAEAHLMRLLAVDGVTGHEAAIAQAVSDELQAVGVPASAIRFDDAHKRIPLPTETGNLIVDLPGTKPGPRLLFSTHLDTVPLCAGAKPIREGDRIVTDGSTALGGDNRTGCALLVTLVETLLKHKLPHPPITLLFTVREESGLHGARELKPADLGGAVMCFNVDGKLASELIVGAVGQENWDVEIKGLASHAGVAPEKGISATLVGAIGLTEAQRAGWFGKVVKPEGHGTSNVGIFGGKPGQPAGDATNVVTDYVHLKGEARSPDAAFCRRDLRRLPRRLCQSAARSERCRRRDGRSEIHQYAVVSALHAGRRFSRCRACKTGDRSDWPETDDCFFQRRARCQLARQAWSSHRDDRCRPVRDSHRERVRRRAGVFARLPAGRRLGNDELKAANLPH